MNRIEFGSRPTDGRLTSVRLKGLALAAMLCGLAWGGAAEANSVTDWNLITVRYVAGGAPIAPQRPGPVGFLDVALVQTAVHDAVQTIEGQYGLYHYTGTGAGNPDAAAAAAAHRLLVLLYPSQQGTLDPLYASYVANHGLTGDSGLAVGEAAAVSLFSQYRPLIPTTPFFGSETTGQWRSTLPMSFETLAVTQPFMLESVTQFRPAPPPPMQSMTWVRQYDEVKAAGSAATYPNANSALADFWNFDPLKLWNGALRDVSSGLSVSESARLFALANLASADSLMTTFSAKRFYNFWRPISAIRNDDGNPKTAPNAGWTPYVTTPNYPEYPSGMNAISGAMTGVMRLYFGTDEVSFQIPGATVSRSYASFSQAAQEVVDVRVLHGVHFREADDDARKLGEKVAHWGWQKFLKPSDYSQGAPVPWVVENVGKH